MRGRLACLPNFPVVALASLLALVACADDALPPAPVPVGSAPRIKFDRTQHDFGPARQRDKRKTTFAVRNEGGSTLHVGVRGGCGCTVVSISKASGGAGGPSIALEPREGATISLTFDTDRFVGPITKSIVVTSDDPSARETAIELKIDVSAGVVLVPQHFFFNMVLAGTHPTSTIDAKWKEGVGKAFQITGIEATNMMPTGVKPDFDIEPFDAPPWHGYKVTMKFADPPPVGMVTGDAILRTDDPDTPNVSALIGGAVSGKVVISQLRTSFGIVEEGKGRTISVTVRPFDATIDLGKVSAKSRKGSVGVRLISTDEPQMKDVWTLELELAKDAPAGEIDDVIELSTEVKGEEKTEISVTGSIVPK